MKLTEKQEGFHKSNLPQLF